MMKKLKHKILAILGALAMLFLVVSCSGRPPLKGRPEAPSPDYVRNITVILERDNFRPVNGAEILVEVEEPTKLLQPASGRATSDSSGQVRLQFRPLPHYQEGAWSGGDIIVDFPIQAKITVYSTKGRISYDIDDLESFARFQDPLYQGLNRDPDSTERFVVLSIP